MKSQVRNGGGEFGTEKLAFPNFGISMFRDNIARRAGRIEIPYPCATSQMVPRQAANQAVRWSCVHRRFLLSLQGDLGRPIPPKKSLFSLPKSTPSRKFVLTLLFSLEMRGKELMPQLTLVEKPA